MSKPPFSTRLRNLFPWLRKSGNPGQSLYPLPREESIPPRSVIKTARWDVFDSRFKYILPRDDVMNNPSTRKDYEAMETDPIVRMAVHLAKLMPITPGYTLKPKYDKDDPRHEEAMRQLAFIESVLPTEMTLRTLYSMMSALWDGYSIVEQEFDLTDQADGKEFQGLLKFSRFIHRNVKEWGFDVTDTLKVKGIVYTPNGALQGISYPCEKFFVYSFDEQFSDPRGRSLKRSLHRPWKIKLRMQHYWAVAADKFGVPPIIGSYELGSLSEDQQNNALTALTNLQSDAACLIPNTVTITTLAMKGGTFDFRSAMQAFNSEIVIGAMAAALGMLESEYGTRAQASEQSGTSETVGSWRQKEIARVWQEQGINRLCALNFADPMPPVFSFNPICEEDVSRIVEVLTKAASMGAIDAEGVDNAMVREKLSFAPLKEGTDLFAVKLQKEAQRLQMNAQYAPSPTGADESAPK